MVMKHPTDKTGKPLVVGGLYTGYNPGVYKLLDYETHKHLDISIVLKVTSGRGVPVNKPKPKKMGNGWLRPIGGLDK